MSDVLRMPNPNHLRSLTTDLDWKRNYLCELKKKRRRQEAAMSVSAEEIATVQREIAALEKLLDHSQDTAKSTENGESQ